MKLAQILFVIWSMLSKPILTKIALIEVLRQRNPYNPSCEESADMIRERSNMEHFEMCETSTKVQRTYCLKYWTIGIVYCTCGVCLLHSTQRLNQERFDLLSIPNYIKKKSHRGAKHGNSQIQRK